MRIFIDIGHPAHVHYFKNFIHIMQEKGHWFFISARDKEITHQLLNYYKIPYQTRGKGKKGMAGKFFYILKADYLLLKMARQFKPDIFISFASPYAAHVAWLMRRPHIVFDDTEHAVLNHLLYKPFSREVITPAFFQKSMGPKHVKFNSLMELCYLYPGYHTPDGSFLKENKAVDPGKKIALIRLVSWDANHDAGISGLTEEELDAIMEKLKPTHQVLISAEGRLPEKYHSCKIQFPPEKIHDLLAYTDLFITEGATMATEAALLGTPVIYINSLNAGTLKMLEKNELIVNLRNPHKLENYLDNLMNDPDIKAKWKKRKDQFISQLEDPTEFMVKHISSYEKEKQE